MLVINDIVTTSRKINTFTGKHNNNNTVQTENGDNKSTTKALPVMVGLLAIGSACYAVHNLKNSHKPMKMQIIRNPNLEKFTIRDNGMHTYDFTAPTVFDVSKIKNNYNISNSWKKYRNDIETRTKAFINHFGIQPESHLKQVI